jgi:hypothetical protein
MPPTRVCFVTKASELEPPAGRRVPLHFNRRLSGDWLAAALDEENHTEALSDGLKAKGEMTMRNLLILTAIIGFSASALAQTAAPKAAGKPQKQIKPATTGCKLVGTVKGAKLWAGDCAAASELRGAAPSTETAPPAPPPPPDTGANPSIPKQ